jgi:hypothetical protein
MALNGRLPDCYEWQDYCEAAQNKIRIAEYHLKCLRAQVGHGQLKEPTIPVQVHFEGILYDFIAATNQIAEAITTCLLDANYRRVPGYG